MNPLKVWFSKNTNAGKLKGQLSDAIEGADLFLGVSRPDLLTEADVKKMNKDAIVFALANPDPEIRPEVAGPHVRVMATGRSDFANQINNVLCFPGLFRGVLDARAWDINEEMKIAAAHAIASPVPKRDLSAEYSIPSAFPPTLVRPVPRATGGARAPACAPAGGAYAACGQPGHGASTRRGRWRRPTRSPAPSRGES